MKDSFLGKIDYSAGSPPSGPSIQVSFSKVTYSLSATGGSWGIPPQPTTGGAAYSYEGRKGTIQLSYANHSQSATAALVTVDATDDDELGGWMGAAQASGPGMVAAGDWTGTASLLD